MARVYATPIEYAEWLNPGAPGTPPTGAQQLLRAASRDVEQALLCALYDVDDTGMPTETDVVDAMRDATCAQAAWRAALGDTAGTGVTGVYEQVNIGALALKRANNAGASTAGKRKGELADEADQILRQAGLLGGEPWTW